MLAFSFYTFSILKDRLAFGEYNERWIMLHKIMTNRFNRILNSKAHPLEDLLVDEAKQFLSDVMRYNGKPFDPKMDFYINFCSVIYQIVYGRGENVREDDDFIQMIVIEKDFIDFATSGNPVEVMPWLSRLFPSLIKPIQNGPRREKTCLRGFRHSEIQTSLPSYRDALENRNFTRGKFTYETYQKANNKGADQSARMRRLVCVCVVRKPPKTGFLALRPKCD